MRRWLLAIGCLCGCSFDLADHPSACNDTADCASGYVCESKLCVRDEAGRDVAAPGSAGAGAGPGATDGGPSSAGDGMGGDAGASTGSAGDAGAADAGSGQPTADPDAAVDSADAAPGDTVDPGNGGADAAPPPDPVEPYSPCGGDDDCNPGERCRLGGSEGSCGAPCSSDGECPATAAGFHTATPICDPEGFCRIDCAPLGPPPLPRSCPQGMSCVTEGIGVLTCYAD